MRSGGQQDGAGARRSTAFLLAVALANAGGVIAWLPVLTLLLPMRVELVAGAARLGLLTATVMAGAVAASTANIAFGWLSDRAVACGRGRRPFVAGGIVAVAAGCALIATAATPVALIWAVAAFQIGVNALLAPMLAVVADEVPDGQKGTAGGLLAMGEPVASALGAGLLALGLSADARFALVPLACLACVAPLLLTRARASILPAPVAPSVRNGRDLALAWVSRTLVQVAGVVLSLYLLYFFESTMPDARGDQVARRVGHLLLLASLAPLPVAILAGKLSDRTGRRKPVLLSAAALAAAGLVGMAAADDWIAAAVGYAVYATGSGVFLALQFGFAMQILPSARHRGRDLGLLNLANTLPALAGPLLAWHLATPHDFGALMLVLAALTAAGGLVTLAAREPDQRRQ